MSSSLARISATVTINFDDDTSEDERYTDGPSKRDEYTSQDERFTDVPSEPDDSTSDYSRQADVPSEPDDNTSQNDGFTRLQSMLGDDTSPDERHTGVPSEPDGIISQDEMHIGGGGESEALHTDKDRTPKLVSKCSNPRFMTPLKSLTFPQVPRRPGPSRDSQIKSDSVTPSPTRSKRWTAEAAKRVRVFNNPKKPVQYVKRRIQQVEEKPPPEMVCGDFVVL
jgi:hypothetical protein